MISIAAVNTPLKGSGTPARAVLSRINEVLSASLAIFIAFDFDACEECNVDTVTSEAETEGSVRSSAQCAGPGVDDLDVKWVRINFLALPFKLLISLTLGY
jgi:hypothetical protein